MTQQKGLAYIQICPAKGSDGAKTVIFAMILDNLTNLGGLS